MLGDLIRINRKKKGLTQRELSDLVGVADMSIWRWELKKNLPLRRYLDDLSQVLDIPLDELERSWLDGVKARKSRRSEKSTS